MAGPRIPALVQVLLAAGALVLLVVSSVLSDDRDVARAAQVVVGEQELVRLTGPDGSTVEAVARIDTGASASSLDTALAEELGLDLEGAETITVASSLGREERPVVAVGLQLAGQGSATRMSVTDRSERSTPVLLGRDDLAGAQVAVGQQLLTQPGKPVSPNAFDAIASQAPTLGAATLLAVLPLAALVVVLLRVVVGIQTLGVFGPVLLAIGYTQAGVVAGVLLTVLMLALGFAAQPLLRRWHLPRVARLAVLVSLVAIGLLAAQMFGGLSGASDSWGSALPVVVTASAVEKLWEVWDMDGATAALKDAGLTLGVALLVTLLLLTPLVRSVAEVVPLQLAIACGVWTWVVGTYKGLRLTELARFRPAALSRREEVPA